MTNDTTQTILARALGRAVLDALGHRERVSLTDEDLLELADHLTVALAGELVLVPKEQADALTTLEREVRGGNQFVLFQNAAGLIGLFESDSQRGDAVGLGETILSAATEIARMLGKRD